MLFIYILQVWTALYYFHNFIETQSATRKGWAFRYYYVLCWSAKVIHITTAKYTFTYICIHNEKNHEHLKFCFIYEFVFVNTSSLNLSEERNSKLITKMAAVLCTIYIHKIGLKRDKNQINRWFLIIFHFLHLQIKLGAKKDILFMSFAKQYQPIHY